MTGNRSEFLVRSGPVQGEVFLPDEVTAMVRLHDPGQGEAPVDGCAASAIRCIAIRQGVEAITAGCRGF